MEGRTNVLRELIYKTDEFRMFAYKIAICDKPYRHDWASCPFLHMGERAVRRDPRLYNYAAIPCPTFKDNKYCSKGDRCNFSHGIVEHWLHPAKYRTRLCHAGHSCKQMVCFFAHSQRELRPETVYVRYYVDDDPLPHYAAGTKLSGDILISLKRTSDYEQTSAIANIFEIMNTKNQHSEMAGPQGASSSGLVLD